jgi:hypothetical protein
MPFRGLQSIRGQRSCQPDQDQNKPSVFVDVAPQGGFILKVTNAGVTIEISMPNDKAGEFAGYVLHNAKESFDRATAKKEPVRLSPGGSVRADVLPTMAVLAKSHRPNHAALVFHFGHSMIGFDIPREHLETIGREMLALSAGGTKQ